jgi:CRISPR/Cas system-associated exonuclease Cas4 (RecB family)
LRTIRASEIGSYLYCRRAWWYQHQGIESQNQAEMALGSELHRRHGRAVLLTGCLRSAAYLLLLAALVMMTIYLVGRFI